jgi:AcrR family transcriptional regulator
MPRPKQRTPELREHVLSVALALLGRSGATDFTARRLAREAGTSPPAIYELFGDKGGLVREVFFAGFRLLYSHLERQVVSEDPRADLIRLTDAYRDFIHENSALAEVMFSRPFTDFAPGPSELETSGSVRILIVDRVARCVEDGVLQGDATDIAHVLVALTQGLAAAENAGRLGSTEASIERRWKLAMNSVLLGMA